MNKSKAIFSKIAEFLGFKRNTPYVNAYIHRANIRSGVFMSAIVVILEIWLIIRQHQKYIIKAVKGGEPYFKSLFDNTSLFWLQMVMGISMFLYCIFYLYFTKKNSKGLLIGVIITSAIGIGLCALLPLEGRIKEFNSKKLVDTILLICLYSSIALFHIGVIIASITRYQGKKIDWLHSVAIISIFATCLLIFGIRVSYGDFTSNRGGVPNPDYKQIICFLMMAIYVGCLLIWRPYISIAILGAVFSGFYLLLKYFETSTGIRKFPDGDFVNYITFFISLLMISISIYSQRNVEAKKDEELEILATRDKLTGLLAFEYFTTLCRQKIEEENIQDREYVYLFINVTSFKILNDQRGFEAGNIFLREVGEIISMVFAGELVSRQGDDHFVVFAVNENIEDKINSIDEQVRNMDFDIRPGVKAGGYLYTSARQDPHTSIEKARYAYAALKDSRSPATYLRYNNEMSTRYKQVQYIVSHIDEAVNSGWIQAYYQPVVYAKDRKLCGVEALSRWIDPEFGFLNPGIFIGALEDSRLAYKLDLAMLEIVCNNMRRVLDNNEVIVPTSINFSRSDFSIVDVPSEINRITSKYDIPTKYLHIEITESALLEEHVDLKEAMSRIKENGFSIWLDDFGSGYSSFNTLKDYSFDVLKLDMEFLKGFETNEKSKPLIKAVISMANQINMRTLAEGVETEEQAKFLNSIGCEKLQGYLISKPITYEELNNGIASGRFVISDQLD